MNAVLKKIDSPVSLEVRDLGLRSYADVYQIQKDLVEARKNGKSESDCLILVEHPGVYTYGRKSQPTVPPSLSSPSFAVERGGESTFHNPGQLVCYPIVKLDGENRDVHRFLRDLEEVLIRTLKHFGIESTRKTGATGVWVQNNTRKIASLGIAVSGWVTYHGSALNVDNELAGFSEINPCGFESQVMVSMKEILGAGHSPCVDLVKTKYLTEFRAVFPRFAV